VSELRTNTNGNCAAVPGFWVTEADKATDAVSAYDAVEAYDADTALLILPEKKDAVKAYEADVALLILPEKYEAVSAKDAVFAFKAINAMSALVVVPIRLIICYKYQSLYSW
jgi:hypothetical protein